MSDRRLNTYQRPRAVVSKMRHAWLEPAMSPPDFVVVDPDEQLPVKNDDLTLKFGERPVEPETWKDLALDNYAAPPNESIPRMPELYNKFDLQSALRIL